MASLIVVCGKGGVGKTTVAVDIAARAVREGRRVILAEVAAKRDAGPWLEGTGVRHVSIAPDDALEEYLRVHLPLRPLAALLPRTRLFSLLAAATPGLSELLTIGKVWELARGEACDVVVLDAPATGHALALLQAPATFAATAATGPVAGQAGAIDAFLRDGRRTRVVGVARAEELAVNETLFLRDRLAAGLGIRLGEVVVTAVYPDRFTRADVAALAAAPPSAARHAARFWAARSRAQRAQLRRLRAGLGRGVSVRTTPFAFSAAARPVAPAGQSAA